MMGLCCLTQSQARDDGWTSCLRGAGSAGGASWARRPAVGAPVDWPVRPHCRGPDGDFPWQGIAPVRQLPAIRPR